MDSTGIRNRTCGRSNGEGSHLDGETISDAVRSWPTANAEDNRATSGTRGETDNPSLRTAAKRWPTAQERDQKGIDQHAAHGEGAPNTSTNRGKNHGGRRRRLTIQGLGPQAEAFPWSTPNATAGRRGADMPAKAAGRKKGPPRELNYDVGTFLCSRPGAETSPTPTTPTGALGLLLRRWTPPSCRALNPNFQWWLMGWPSPARIFSASGATEWSRWRQLLLSSLFGLLPSAESEAAA